MILRSTAIPLLICGLLWPAPGQAAAAARPPRISGVLEADVQSEFSHIRVRRQGSLRMLCFVRDGGEEVVETMLNLKRPYEPLIAYSRWMFASYLFVPVGHRVLIVGLGGGAMVHFLRHYDAEAIVDAVEIDPAVVKIADRWFDVRRGENVRIFTEDGLAYLRRTEDRYDVIYMDAFLKPSRETDSTGLPLRLKTVQFYQDVQTKLTPGGVVVFNLNQHASLAADIQALRSAFAQVYVFRTPEPNVVVVGSGAKPREPLSRLQAQAKTADHRLKASFSFQELLKSLARDEPGG
ncbi:MAG: fused MFS/spermidine synthase [Thermoguttaceae bacterium]|jgi:spermidine synthase